MLIEIIFLFITKSIKPPTSSSLPSAIASPSPPRSLTQFGILPIGYYIPDIDNTSLIFLGQFNSIDRNSNGDITADISFGLNRGYGQIIHKQFLLYTTDEFIHRINLIKSNSLSLTLQANERKNFVLDPVKEPNQTVNTLKKYLNQKVMLDIWTTLYLPGKKQPSINSPAQTQGRLHTLIDCNKSFLDALNNDSSIPSCSPYIESITVYDKNF